MRVVAGAGVTAAQVAAALASHCGAQADSALYSLQAERWLDDHEEFSAQPRVRGTVLLLAPRGTSVRSDRDGPTGALELVGVGGPAMGGRWVLSKDRTTVGRGRECDVTIDDPALSRRHLEIETRGGAVRVTDADSTNGTFVNGIPVEPGRELGRDEVLEAGACLLSVRPVRGPATRSDHVSFNRPPRVRAPHPEVTVLIPAPPPEPERARLPLAAAGLPILIALLMWAFFPDNPSLLLIMALSPVLAIGSYAEERRRGAASATQGERRWRTALDAAVTELEGHRSATVDHLRSLAPAAAELEERAATRAPTLWERRSGDDDFLLLRVGWGDRRWDADVRRETGGSDRLATEADERIAPLLVLPSVPLVVSLPEVGVVGLCGDAPAVQAAGRWLALQIATLHAPSEVRLIPLLAHRAERRWAGWLPHSVAELDGSAAARHVAEALEGGERAIATVVLADAAAGMPRELLTRMVRGAGSGNLFVVWLGGRREDLPGECRAIVEVSSAEGRVAITHTEGAITERGTLEGLDEATARRMALALAPIRDADLDEDHGALPGSVSLLEALGPSGADPDAVRARWRSSPPGLLATIGSAAGGPFSVDLVSDGPHSLVGGMTGSGKSELLQALVASLASSYDPTRVNFLLIDYKGGAAFNECSDLPHVVGLVTDLDGSLAQRALASLNAELRRRETILRDVGVRDISDLAGEAVLPRLVLIIDEFATLVKEVPGFVEGVVDIAQRGRSLGIHLVLATQRPAGVVTDAIRANTNVRICLRVADDADSLDVIGVRSAASIPRSLPGRAFARRGAGEVVEFQVAHATAVHEPDAPLLEVRDLWEPTAPAAAELGDGASQLRTLVRAVSAASAGEGHAPPRSPWAPPLPASLALEDLPSVPRPAVAFGLVDRPHLQALEPAGFELEADGGLAVFGTGGAGKTTLLVSVAAALAKVLTPAELHIYGLDAAGGGLRQLAALPHCGDVVMSEDLDRVRRLFFMLRREIEERKAAADGSSDAGDESAAGPTTRPKILVLIDGYAGFTSAFERIDLGELVDAVPRLVSEGRSVGINFLISAERRSAIPAAVAALMPKKVVLRMGDDDEYSALGLNPRSLRAHRLPPGRGFLEGEEIQVATPGGASSREDIAAAIAALGSADPDQPRRAPRVEVLPEKVALAASAHPTGPLTGAFAVAERAMSPAVLDLSHSHAVVAGPYRSGRSTALGSIAQALRASTSDARMVLLAPRKTPLTELDLWSTVAAGSLQCEQAVAELDPLGSATTLLFVDDAEELEDGASGHALQRLVKVGRDENLRVVAAAESRALHRSYGGWLQEIRKDKHGLLLDPDVDIDGDLLGTKLPRRRVAFPPGRGYLVARGSVELVQVALEITL